MSVRCNHKTSETQALEGLIRSRPGWFVKAISKTHFNDGVFWNKKLFKCRSGFDCFIFGLHQKMQSMLSSSLVYGVGEATMCPDYKGLAANELIVLYRSLYGIDQYVTSKYYIPSKRFNQPASALMRHNSTPRGLSCGGWSLSKRSSRLPWATLNRSAVYHRTRLHVSGLWEDVRCG